MDFAWTQKRKKREKRKEGLDMVKRVEKGVDQIKEVHYLSFTGKNQISSTKISTKEANKTIKSKTNMKKNHKVSNVKEWQRTWEFDRCCLVIFNDNNAKKVFFFLFLKQLFPVMCNRKKWGVCSAGPRPRPLRLPPRALYYKRASNFGKILIYLKRKLINFIFFLYF